MRMCRQVLLLLSLSVVFPCAAAEPAPTPAPPPLQWPAAPAAPRLRFLSEIRGENDAPEKPRGKFAALLRAALGIGPGSGAGPGGLSSPAGLFARDGTLYVADPGRAQVLRYDLGKSKGEWLPKGRGQRLASPVGVAAAPDGRVFILDSSLGKVFILDREGKPKGELEGDPQGLGRPAAIAASDQRLYVADTRNHRIMVYGMEGVFLTAFGRRGTGPGEFNYPTYLYFDRRSGQLWVCDSGNFRVQWFDADGRHLGTLGEAGDRPGYLARPRGLARDSDGHVYVADAAFDAFQILDPEGKLLLFVGRAGTAPGQFNLPGGLFSDEQDRIFAADSYNGRVQTFQYLKEGGL
ncbi:MAG: 6-bladed beta-propeller [Elusimicrobia bacterium]|nr:6-bladed beta-propeller [Elusimicrobiota bacterium]